MPFSRAILLKAGILRNVSDCAHHLRDDRLVTMLLLAEELEQICLNIVYSLDALGFIVGLSKLRLLLPVVDLPVNFNCFLEHEPKVCLMQVEDKVLASHFCELAKVLLSPSNGGRGVSLFKVLDHGVQCLELILERCCL